MKRTLTKIITAGAAILGLAAGSMLVTAGPAAAGTSISRTYNGATGMYYTYYASTNDFCIEAPKSLEYAEVTFGTNAGYGRYSVSSGEKNCIEIVDPQIGISEGERVDFALLSMKTMSSPAKVSRGVVHA